MKRPSPGELVVKDVLPLPFWFIHVGPFLHLFTKLLLQFGTVQRCFSQILLSVSLCSPGVFCILAEEGLDVSLDGDGIAIHGYADLLVP